WESSMNINATAGWHKGSTTPNRRESPFVDCLRGLTEQNPPRLFGHRRVAVDPRTPLIGAHRGGTALDGIEPALQMREVVEILALRFMRNHPGIRRHVGNRVGSGDVFT